MRPLRELRRRVHVQSQVSQSRLLQDLLVLSPASQFRHLQVPRGISNALRQAPVRGRAATAAVHHVQVAVRAQVAVPRVAAQVAVLRVEQAVQAAADVQVAAVVQVVQQDADHQSDEESVVATAKNSSR